MYVLCIYIMYYVVHVNTWLYWCRGVSQPRILVLGNEAMISSPIVIFIEYSIKSFGTGVSHKVWCSYHVICGCVLFLSMLGEVSGHARLVKMHKSTRKERRKQNSVHVCTANSSNHRLKFWLRGIPWFESYNGFQSYWQQIWNAYTWISC